MKLHLLIVDPQNDFCVADDGAGNRGQLVVPGALEDMYRLAKFIGRLGDKIDDISITLDSHQMIGVERPGMWRRVSDGAEPAPFTCLGIHPDGRRIVKYEMGGTNPNAFGMSPTEEEYTTAFPSWMHQFPGRKTPGGAFEYLQALAAKGRYPHVIWTEHCVVGTWGHSLVPVLSQAVCAWERKYFGRANYVVKGNNPWTEHFSGVQAEVPDPSDPSTQINTGLVTSLEEADIILLSGEALSHCVANTGRDVAAAFNPANIRKMVLLTDASSNVQGYDFLGNAFVKDLVAQGMRTETTVGFAA